MLTSDEPTLDFTTLEQSEIDVTDCEEAINVPTPSSASTSPPSSLNLSGLSGATSTYTVTTRRHHYPAYLPLLTLLRYSSTIKMAEIVTTSFSTLGIQHSAVS